MECNLKFDYLYDVNNLALFDISVLLFEKDYLKFYVNKILLLLRLKNIWRLFSVRNMFTVLEFKTVMQKHFLLRLIYI